MISERRTRYDRQITGRCSSFCLRDFYDFLSLTLHGDIISVYISVSVYQNISLTLHDDIISVYISASVYQQMSLISDDAQNDITRHNLHYST
jgi:hypothetical protein